MKQSKKIAVTGGIGSGKSAFCGFLRAQGFPVFSCDEISRELWKEPWYLCALAKRFPDCTREGKIEKSLLTARVFSDPAARKALESYAHPLIMARLTEEMDRCALSFAEVPLLYEGGYEGLFDGIVVVQREEEARIRAVSLRDGTDGESVRARMRAQAEAYSFEGKDVIVVPNDGTEEDLKEQALRAAAHFCRGAGEERKA